MVAFVRMMWFSRLLPSHCVNIEWDTSDWGMGRKRRKVYGLVNIR